MVVVLRKDSGFLFMGPPLIPIIPSAGIIVVFCDDEDEHHYNDKYQQIPKSIYREKHGQFSLSNSAFFDKWFQQTIHGLVSSITD